MAQEVTSTVAESERPAMLLDVDGVLRVSAHQIDDYNTDFVADPSCGWFAYNPASALSHGQWLRQVNETADIYYISDWREKCHDQVGKRLELPEFDWINSDPYWRFSNRDAEVRALAITALFGERPLVWVDDAPQEPEFAWAQARNKHVAPTLIIKTDQARGLQLHEMKFMDLWFETNFDR